jgi:hypothetical protein
LTVDEAIAAADAILPGTAAPDGETDLRWQAVIAVVLEHHFDRYISKIEEAVLADSQFAAAVTVCSRFGQSENSAIGSARFDRLHELARQRSRSSD